MEKFDFPAERVLTWLSHGYGDGEPIRWKSTVAQEGASLPGNIVRRHEPVARTGLWRTEQGMVTAMSIPRTCNPADRHDRKEPEHG
jgi:hypothetical protein